MPSRKDKEHQKFCPLDRLLAFRENSLQKLLTNSFFFVRIPNDYIKTAILFPLAGYGIRQTIKSSALFKSPDFGVALLGSLK